MRRHKLPALLAAFLLLTGANWVRDDAGVPSAQCAFIGSSGAPTLCSTTDPLPTSAAGAAPTTSTTDPIGWGLRWLQSTHAAPAFGNTFALTAPNQNNIFAFGASGGGVASWVSTDQGRSFTNRFSSAGLGLVNQINSALALTTGDTLVGANALQGVAGQCGLVRSANGGAFTTATLGGYPAGIACHVLSIGQQGNTALAAVIDAANALRLCRSTDAAITWTCAGVASGGAPGTYATGDNQAITSPAPNTWLLVGTAGADVRIFRSVNDGVSWTLVLNMGAGAGGNVLCVSPTICLATRRDATVRRSTDGGATWVTQATMPVAGWTAGGFVNFGGGVVALIPSAAGVRDVFRTADSGDSWQQGPLLNANEQVGVFNTGIAVNGLGLFSSAAFGTTPLIMYSPIIGPGQTQIVGASGVILNLDASGNPTVNQGTRAASAVATGWRVNPLTPSALIQTRACNAPAANTAATVTVTGVANNIVSLFRYNAYYNPAPAGPLVLTVTDGATTVWQDAVAGALTPTFRDFGAGYNGATGATIVVTLPAGGVGVSGVLCVHAGQIQP